MNNKFKQFLIREGFVKQEKEQITETQIIHNQKFTDFLIREGLINEMWPFSNKKSSGVPAAKSGASSQQGAEDQWTKDQKALDAAHGQTNLVLDFEKEVKNNNNPSKDPKSMFEEWFFRNQSKYNLNIPRDSKYFRQEWLPSMLQNIERRQQDGAYNYEPSQPFQSKGDGDMEYRGGDMRHSRTGGAGYDGGTSTAYDREEYEKGYEFRNGKMRPKR